MYPVLLCMHVETSQTDGCNMVMLMMLNSAAPSCWSSGYMVAFFVVLASLALLFLMMIMVVL